MYVIITGCGRMGSTLARDLANEGHDIAIIDSSSERLNSLGSGFNGNRIKGVEYDTDILRMAGIEYANVFLAMTPDDNINIAGAQIARDIYRVPRVIARICEPQKEFIYKRLNIETISPTQSGANIVRSRILETGSNLIVSLDLEFQILEIVAGNHGKKTAELLESRFQCRISGIVRDGVTHLAGADEQILPGDRLICMVSSRDKAALVATVTGEAI